MRKKISTNTLKATYGSVRLAGRLLESLQAVGYDLDRLSAADLITFDELHVMGRQATVSLGQLAGLTDAMRVLDIGSGLGGSARTLARASSKRVLIFSRIRRWLRPWRRVRSRTR